MPFCPECRYEYTGDVDRCPDCGKELVAELPPLDEGDETSLEDKYRDWVQIARIRSYEFAEMVIDAWESKGIPCVMLSGTGYFGKTGQMGVSSPMPIGGGYSLMVPREFVSDADIEAEIILGDAWHEARLIDIERQ